MSSDDLELNCLLMWFQASLKALVLGCLIHSVSIAVEPSDAPKGLAQQDQPPAATGSKKDDENLPSDTLYQAILKELRGDAAPKAMVQPDGQAKLPVQESYRRKNTQPQPILAARQNTKLQREEWLAMEHLLRAARILEREANRVELSETRQIKLRGVVDALRSSAQALLEPDNPTAIHAKQN